MHRTYLPIRKRRRSRQGLSLTEVLVAAILTILIAQATTAALVINARTSATAVDESQFLRIVTQDVERARDLARTLCLVPPADGGGYGNVEDCALTTLKQRCDPPPATPPNSTGSGLGVLLSSRFAGTSPFTNITFTGQGGQTVTVNRVLSSRRPPGSSSFSTLRLTYTTTGLARNLSYVTEVVPEAVGWCSTATT